VSGEQNGEDIVSILHERRAGSGHLVLLSREGQGGPSILHQQSFWNTVHRLFWLFLKIDVKDWPATGVLDMHFEVLWW
jgi:hypothetical protein